MNEVTDNDRPLFLLNEPKNKCELELLQNSSQPAKILLKKTYEQNLHVFPCKKWKPVLYSISWILAYGPDCRKTIDFFQLFKCTYKNRKGINVGKNKVKKEGNRFERIWFHFHTIP